MEVNKEFQKAEVPTEGHCFVHVIWEYGKRIKSLV